MTLFLVLGGLLILTLVLASIAQRYHAYVEERRRQIERIFRRVAELEEIAQGLQGLPVPPEAVALLRRDILARLEVVKQVYPRQPGIDGLIAKARAQQMEDGPVEAAPAGLGESDFERLMRGLGQVQWMLRERRFVTPLREDESRRLSSAITQRQTESIYHYHRREAERRVAAGQLHQALWHCAQVRQFLREQGPDSEQASEWYREMDRRHCEISAEISGQSSDTSGGPPSP